MAKLANFSSPRPVKAQLQAALFYARKKRLQRINSETVSVPSVWGEGAIRVGEGAEKGFILGEYGQMIQQINPAHPILRFTTNETTSMTLVLSGNTVDHATGRTFFIGPFELIASSVSYDAGSNSTTIVFDGEFPITVDEIVYFGFGEDS